MAIFERTTESGKTIFDVYVQDWNVHGKRVQKKRRGFESQRSAREAEAKLRAELMLEKGRPERLTWEMWFERFMREMQVTKRPSTCTGYETTLNKWITPHLNGRYLDEITSHDIHRIIFQEMPAVAERRIETTQHSVLRMLKRVLGQAVHEGVIGRNPAHAMRVAIREPIKKALTTKEVQRLLAEAQVLNHRFYEVWATALMTGMRSGELYALRWEDVVLVQQEGPCSHKEQEEPSRADLGELGHAPYGAGPKASGKGPG